MGELILCNEKLAKNPYFIEDVPINIYSLEELCYYIKENCYLLGSEFVSEELAVWIGRELGAAELSEELLKQVRGRADLAGFVAAIFAGSGYLPEAEARAVLKTLKEMENKSEFECGKIRADRYMQSKRYIAAIYEYRRILNMDEANPIIVGDAWHNLGTAYAGLFLFSEAIVCYEHAYMRNENPESLRECIYACMCISNESMIRRIAEKYQVTGELLRDIRREWDEANDKPGCDISDMDISYWKEEYRRNCRI